MRAFAYEALDASGRRLAGSARAAGVLELDRELEQRGLLLVAARTAGGPFARGPLARGRLARGGAAHGALSRRELARWLAQLSTTTAAGVPLARGLATVGERLEDPRARGLMADVALGIEAGQSLSEALARHPRAFPATIVAAVRAGEASGELGLVLERLARHLEWQRGLRASATQALVYPCVLLGAVAVLVLVLLVHVLPRVVALYPTGAAALPFETRSVLWASRALVEHGAWLAAACAAAAALGARCLAHPAGRRRAHRALLAVPRVGRLCGEIATARFAATAGMLHSAGCDVVSVLSIAGEACGNAAMAAGFARAGERVRGGATIADALARESWIDPLLLQMVHVGEASGELGGTLARVAGYYDEEVPRSLKRATALLEPLLLVGAGVVVAYVLLATLLPIFDLYGAIG